MNSSMKKDDEKSQLKLQINAVFAEIITATNGIPKSIASAKFEKAKAWKETAVAWRKVATKGCGNFSVPKLNVLLVEAKNALATLKAA